MVQPPTLPPTSVMYTIPPEVWRLIFGAFHRESSTETSALDIICLSHVCTLWRTIIINAPELWTKVSLEVHYTQSLRWTFPNAELLSLILSRSHRMPLTMRLELKWFSSGGRRRGIGPVKLFMLATERAKELTLNLGAIERLLDFDTVVYDELMQELQPARLLEDLRLNVGYSDEESAIDSEFLSKLWKDASLIRSAHFYGATLVPLHIEWLDMSYFPFHQLTTLKADAEVECLWDLLPKLAPRLVTAAFDLTGRRQFEIENKQTIHLNTLEELTLLATDDEDEERGDSDEEEVEEDAEPLMRVLEFMVSPALKTLSLCFWSPMWSLDALQKFLDRSSQPRIENLSLNVAGGPPEDKVKCLRMLPNLQTLCLTMIRHYGGTNGESDEYIQGGFWGALKEWDGEAGEFVLCNNLERITVSYDALLRTGVADFTEMVENRWRQSPEGKTFEIVITDADSLIGKGRSRAVLSEVEPLLTLKDLGLNLTIEPISWFADLLL